MLNDKRNLDKLDAAASIEDMLELSHASLQSGQFDDAFKILRTALLKKRDHPDVLKAIENMIDLVDNRLEIIQVLEPIYISSQNHQKLVWILEKKLELTSDIKLRKAMMRRIGDLYENRLDNRSLAFMMGSRLVHEDPADMASRMWIEKVATDMSSFRELAEFYAQEAQHIDSKPLKIQFYSRSAAIFHDKLSDPMMAIQQYQAILNIDPHDEKSLVALEDLFKSIKDFFELLKILRLRLDNTSGVERKRDIFYKIMAIQSNDLYDIQAAVDTAQEILKFIPDDAKALENIEVWLSDLEQWQALDNFYLQEINRLSHKKSRDAVAHRLDILFQRALLNQHKIDNQTTAFAIFKVILQEAPKNADTIEHLEQEAKKGTEQAFVLLEDVYQHAQEWQKLLDLMRVKLLHVIDQTVRYEILNTIANIYEHHLHQPKEALMTMYQSYKENIADLSIFQKLEKFSEKHNLWQNLVEYLTIDLDHFVDIDIKKHILHHLGDICGTYLNQVDTAILYLKQALQYDPNDLIALRSLDTLLEKNQMWKPLADILEHRVEMATNVAEKSTLLERLASVWADKLMDPAVALRCHKQILDIDPEHPITLKAMQKLYEDMQDWDALAHNLHKQSHVLMHRDEQIRIYTILGLLYAEELHDNEQAIEIFLKIIDIDKQHPIANQWLQVLLTSTEKWQEIAELYRLQLTYHTNPKDVLDINQRLGVILSDKLNLLDDALVVWKYVSEQDPKNTTALQALMSIYYHHAEWLNFVYTSRMMLSLAQPDVAKKIRFDLVYVLGEKLHLFDEAIRVARDIRATEPCTADDMTKLADVMARIEAWEEAVLALEKAGDLHNDTAKKISFYLQATDIYQNALKKPHDARLAFERVLHLTPSHEQSFAALRDIYQEIKDWRKLVALYDSYIAYCSADFKLALLQEIRDIYAVKLGEKDLAFVSACRVYKENSNDLKAADILEEMAIQQGCVDELVAFFEDEIEHITEQDIVLNILHRLSRLYAENMQDITNAEIVLNRILDIRNNDMAALDYLIVLSDRSGQFEQQILYLERKIKYVQDEKDRKSILYNIADIWKYKINDMNESVACLQRVLTIDGSDLVAIDALIDIFKEQQQTIDLIDMLSHKMNITEDILENIELRMHVADLYEHDLKDLDSSVFWLNSILELDPKNLQALSSLEKLYANLEHWNEIIAVFEKQIDISDKKEDKINILSKIASIYENEFEDIGQAIAAFEKAIAIDNTHIYAYKSLFRLLRSVHDWPRLIQTMHDYALQVSDLLEKIVLYTDIADIFCNQMQQIDKAIEYYKRVYELDATHKHAVHMLGKLYQDSGNFTQALDMLHAELNFLGVSHDALVCLVRIGDIHKDTIVDTEVAKKSYIKALSIDPRCMEALQGLKDIAYQDKKWDSYISYLNQQINICDNLDTKAELLLQAAVFYQDIEVDHLKAIDFYRQAFNIKSQDHAISSVLSDLYFEHDMWAEAKDLYLVALQKIDKHSDMKEFCKKHYRLGYAFEKLGMQQDALSCYKQSFEADPTYLPVLESLSQALLLDNNLDEAQKILQIMLIEHRDTLSISEIVDIQYQLANIALKQHEFDKAYQQFEKALEVDPHHPGCLQALVELDKRFSKWDTAYLNLKRLSNVAEQSNRQEIFAQMADIAQKYLQDIDKSIEAMEHACSIGNPSAAMLEKLAQFYILSNHPHKAIEAFNKAFKQVETNDKRSDICYTMGDIYVTYLQNESAAIDQFNASLDALPTNFKAFERIEKILAQKKDWLLLETNYRAMIARAKTLSVAIRCVLWQGLAELYDKPLNNKQHAMMAYDVLYNLAPQNLSCLEALARLYGEDPSTYDKAIDINHALISMKDSPVDILKVLLKMYQTRRHFDAAYVMCVALDFLKEANDEVLTLKDYLKKGLPERATRGINEDQWQWLIDPVACGPIGQLASGLYRLAPDFVTTPAKDLRLKKKYQLDVRQSELYFANMVRYVSKLLSLPVIDLFRKTDSMETLQLMPALPPALVGGEAHPIFRDMNQHVVLFQIGRYIAATRPELFLSHVYNAAECRDMLFGLCIIYNRTLSHTGDIKNVQRWANHFEKLSTPILNKLRPMAENAYTDLLSVDKLNAYHIAVEKTILRAGLLVASDLPTAISCISDPHNKPVNMPVRDAIRDLVLFFVSKSNLDLRQLMGAALENQP